MTVYRFIYSGHNHQSSTLLIQVENASPRPKVAYSYNAEQGAYTIPYTRFAIQ